MINFLRKWWAALLLFLSGFGAGIWGHVLYTAHWSINYDMTLKYLSAVLTIPSAVLTFPTALILIFFVLFTSYKEEFRGLISRIRGAKVAGAELTFGDKETLEAQLVETTVSALERSKITAIKDSTPEGAERETKMREMREESEKLRQELKEALDKLEPFVAKETEEIRGSLQDSFNKLMPGFNIKPVSMGGDLDEMKLRWPRFRQDVIDALARTMPVVIEIYGMEAFAAAIDAAFTNYIQLPKRSTGFPYRFGGPNGGFAFTG